VRTPQDPTDETADAVGEPRKRRPSPASRARRIGGATVRPGRPAPAASRTTAEPAAPTAEPTVERADPAVPVELGKPAPKPAPTPEPKAAPTPEPQPAPAAEPTSSRGIALHWVPSGVLAIAVLTLLVLAVVFSHGVYWAKKTDSAGARTVAQEQVLAATKKCFAQINTYDYRHLDGLMKTDLACTTGTFTADLKKALQTQILRLAPKVHASQTAQINKAGIASVSPGGGQVVTVIYGQFSVTNDNTAKQHPRVDVVGAVVTVDKVHGKWLISKVDSDVPTS
jgi:hypothetical protein